MSYGYLMGDDITFCTCSEAIRKKAGLDRVVVDDLVFYFCKKCGLELSASMSSVVESQEESQNSLPRDSYNYSSSTKPLVTEDEEQDGLLIAPKPTAYRSILVWGLTLLLLGLSGLVVGLLTFALIYFDKTPGIVIMAISGAIFSAGVSLLFLLQFVTALGEIIGMHIANAANFLSKKDS